MSTKQIIIGSARIDEYGNVSGGKQGDNNGLEVSIQPFYIHKKGWYVVRPETMTLANKVAKKMIEACENDNIGYNQSRRLEIYNTGISTKRLSSCDCSSLVCEIMRECGFKEFPDTTTTYLADYLIRFSRVKNNKKLTYSDGMTLYTGDILVTKTKGHAAVVVSGEPRGKKNKEKDSELETVARDVINGVYGNGSERKTKLKKAGYNYEAVQARVNEILRG